MMTGRLTRILLPALVLLLAATCLHAQPLAPTLCYTDQWGVTRGVIPPPVLQKTEGIGSAHGVCAQGLDGICYGLYDECLGGNVTQTKYQEPQASAGQLVIDWWTYYWGSPNGTNRCYALPAGRLLGPVPAPPPPCPGGQVVCPWQAPAGGVFAPVIRSCSGAATPTPTVTPAPPPPTVTPGPNPYADWIEALFNEGISAGCGGGNFCPNNPMTRAQVSVWLLKAQHGAGWVPPKCVGIFVDVPCGQP